jgi:SAM-dependent methyltransferase
MTCPLCASPSTPVDARYHECGHCLGRFMDPALYLPPDAERAEYALHQNDIRDPRYQAFVKPLTDAVRQKQAPGQDGLDVGSGPASVIAHVLKPLGYRMQAYDPFFRPDLSLLAQTYDFITCSETAEHFHHPRTEFQRLQLLLRPGGRLYLSTLLYDDSIPFANWHYRRDPTHAFIYRAETIYWIAEHLGFDTVEIQGRVTTLRKSSMNHSK